MRLIGKKKFVLLAFIILMGCLLALWYFLPKTQTINTQKMAANSLTTSLDQKSIITPSFTPLEDSSSSDYVFSNPDQTLPSTVKGDSRKVKLFRLKESSSGFFPSSIVIHRTDTVRFEFTALDGDYDLAIAPPIGAYIAAAKGGSTLFGFDARSIPPGVYIFVCQKLCPPQHPQGTLVIQ